MDSPDDTLHSAVVTNDLETAEFLLSEKIDIFSKNDEGLTALDILIKKKIELFVALYEKRDEEFKDFSLKPKDKKALDEADAKMERHPHEYLYSYRERDIRWETKFNMKKKDALNTINKKIEENDRFMNMILKHQSINDNCTKDARLLKFHAACTLKDSSIADNLSNNSRDVKQSVRRNCPIYPGYTALHFAAHCNIDTVKMLVTKGANLLAVDAEGVTAFNICIKSFSLEEIQSIFSMIPAWQNILFSDGKTKLIDYISSLSDAESHKNLLQQIGKNIGVSLSKSSPLWPGFTVLHVAVTLLPESNIEMFREILNLNTDIVTTQDTHGSTPVHLAFRRNKLKVLDMLLKNHKKIVNPLDKDDLCHMHIAAAVNRQLLVNKLLKIERNFNAAYKGRPLATVKLGWTPLHTAVHTNHVVVAKSLLEHGANLLAVDSRGFTPIHLLINPATTSKMSEILFASDQLKESVVKTIGLTHLHVAVWKNDTKAIKQLVDSGADMEATIGKVEDEQLQKFEGFKPIHLTMVDHMRPGAFTVLLEKGADVLAKKLDGSSALYELLTGKYDNFYLTTFVKFFWSNEKFQNRLKRELGMTMLHLACYIFDEGKIQELLKKKVNVNARTRNDSSIWPGYTAMHVLLAASFNLEHYTTAQTTVDNLCGVLIKHGADVTLANADGDTPVLMALKSRHLNRGNVRASFLMSHQKDFSKNPMNKVGMSHFHTACLLYEVEIAKKFLKKIRQIDVNQAISSFDTSRFSGHTPLLLAMTPCAKKSYIPEAQVKMVNLLLERGADIHAVDGFGYTALHKICSCNSTRKDLLDKILIDNTDINKQAFDGKTPLEILLWENATVGTEEIKYFIEHGAKINTYNPVSDVGYMAIVLKNCKYPDEILKIMLDLPDIVEVSDSGRNAIHNAVAVESSHVNVYGYGRLIDKLITLGCDIFQQDDKGRTPLHLAVEFQNEIAVLWLLNCGADVNALDAAGKSPFFYACEFRKDRRRWNTHDSNASICKVLAVHLRKLQLVGLQVSDMNAKLLKAVLEKREDINVKPFENVIKQRLSDAAKIKMCERGFTLRDFLCPTGVVNLYSTLNQSNRNAIDSFVKSASSHELPELKSFLNLQYRNALERSSLIALAEDGLKRLLGLPDLCVMVILKYLTNLDLKHVTMASIVRENQSVIVD